MPSAPSSSSATAPPQGETSGRASLLMWVGMVGVLLIAVALLLGHSATRRAGLLDHYDRAAARAAHQVALRWLNVAPRLAPAYEADPPPPSSSESDGAVTVETCEASASDKPVFVSDDGLALVRRRGDGECGRVLFSTLLRGPRTIGAGNRARTRRFDQVLLLDGDGRVLAEEQETPQLSFNVLPTSKPLSAAPALSVLTLGAVEYQAFLRPVRIPGNTLAGVPTLYVCGLVRKQTLVDDSLQVESSFVLLGLFLLAMAVVALPAAKLWLTGPQVRYRRRDVNVFRAATVTGMVLTLILMLGAVARASLCARLEGQLANIAAHLGGQVSSRVQQSAEALRRFDRENVWPHAASTPLPAQGCRRQQAVLNDFPARWNVVFRLDARGRQTDKLYRRTATPCVEVAEREYFRMVQQRNLRDLRLLADAARPAPQDRRVLGAAEVVRSRTTGQLSLIVAMPEAHAPDHTLVLETSLRDLARQLMPRGIQTAVIDDMRGVTMLHSDNAAFQEQTFFDDVDRGSLPALRAALQLNIQGGVSLEYLGTPSRVFLQPLQAGWTAIAIAPEALVDLPTRKIVLLTLLLCLGAALCALCVGLVRWALRVSRWKRVAEAGPRRGAAIPVQAAPAQAAEMEGTPPGGISYVVLGSAVAARVSGSQAALSSPGGAPPEPTWLQRLVTIVPMPGLATAGAVALLLTVVVFEQSYQRVVEDSVSAELQQAGQQRLWSPECFPSRSGATRADAECIALHSAPPPATPAEKSMATLSGPPATAHGGLLLSMMDIVLKLAEFDSDSVVLPPRAQTPSLMPWQFARDGAELKLHIAPTGETLTAALPSLANGLRPDARTGTLLLVTAVCLVLAAFATWASLRRLSFARTPLRCNAETSVPSLLAARDRRVLVLFPQHDLESELRKAGLRELRPGDPDSEEIAFIANAQRSFRAPSRLVKTIDAYSGRLIVLSTVDWTRGLPPEQRGLLDRTFGSFEMWVGPGIGRWPASPPARRALASELWSDSSDDERSFLARLALDGYVAPHPDNEVLLMHLRDRGVVCRDRLAFAQSEFRTYVRHTASAHELRNAASVRQNDAWNAVRVPLATAALLTLVFVSYMQPELAALGVPISSVLAAARPLFRLLGVPADS